MAVEQAEAVKQADSYLDHPLFGMAMQALQKGEWQTGLSQIEELMQVYPLEAELRALRQEMLLRARIDQDEREDKSLARRRRLRSLMIRAGVIVILIILAVQVNRSYSAWFQAQIATARDTVESQVREMQLAVKLRDARDFLNAGRTDTSLTLLNEIAALDPNYPGVAELKAQVERQQTLEAQYAEAMRLAEQGNVNQALAAFREIESLEPYYRDVKLQIAALEQQTELGQRLAEADSAFAASDWERAASLYEEFYLYHPDFQTAHVEERLFTSFVKTAETKLYGSSELEAIQAAEEYYRKALSLRPQDPNAKARQAQVRAMVEERLFRGYLQLAREAVTGQPDSREALEQVDAYLSKALSLRPNDEEVALERDLAHRFVQAQTYFEQGNWSLVIDSLEYVYSQDKGYASGTARQTLYEAYVARGDSAMAIGDFDSALSDYQRAAVIAEEDPSSKLRLYEVQLKIAEAQGVLGDYQDAVRLFASAIDLANLKERAPGNSAAMASALANAERYAGQGAYRAAFRSYREAIQWATQTLDVIEYTVVAGDYLSSLARRYGSTVSLIVETNDLDNPNLIITGQVLLIPILP